MAITLNGSSGINTPGVVNTVNETIAGTLQVGGVATNVYPLVSGTAVASTSGTSIDFTSIPSWVKRITVMFSGVSTNGTSHLLLQLGDSGGIENTGYLGSASIAASSGVNGLSSNSAGFELEAGSTVAASLRYGFTVLSKFDGNSWVNSGTFGIPGLNATVICAGSKTLSDTLTQVRITTVNGTDTFDAGSINLLYE
jgi:hypothetical protein